MSAPASAPVVEARGLTKVFSVQTGQAMSLKELVLRSPLQRSKRADFVALDDVSFAVERGRSLAIVGSNGSGKSTLLKLIAGITKPTRGSIIVREPVAGLLELGAGFQPEFTGMENIFLQGSLLGMSRAEILDRLDGILDFCELGDFIHTPLKRYSSGMVVRLGFALAVCSDAPLLLVDEVLAVGDAAFQAKCLRTIERLRAEGRTLLFVSHEVPHIESVADDMLWLEKGVVRARGPVGEVLPLYLDALTGNRHALPSDNTVAQLSGGRADEVLTLSAGATRTGDGRARIRRVELLNPDGQPDGLMRTGESMTIRVSCEVFAPLETVMLEIGIVGLGEVRMAWISTEMQGLVLRDVAPGLHTITGTIERLPFRAGRFGMSMALSTPTRPMVYHDVLLNAFTFQVAGRTEVAWPRAMTGAGRFEVGETG